MLIDLDRLRDSPLSGDPFDHIVVPGFGLLQAAQGRLNPPKRTGNSTDTSLSRAYAAENPFSWIVRPCMLGTHGLGQA